MFSTSKTLFFLAAFATATYGYQQVAGPACTTAPGTACSWDYPGVDTNGNSVDVTANGYCGPAGSDGVSYCATNGAICQTDDNCYQFCGSNGICGGVGALCYDQGTDPDFIVCNQPSAICSVNCEGDHDTCDSGTCLLGASQAAGFRKVKRVQRDFAAEARHLALRRAASFVARPGDEVLA